MLLISRRATFFFPIIFLAFKPVSGSSARFRLTAGLNSGLVGDSLSWYVEYKFLSIQQMASVQTARGRGATGLKSPKEDGEGLTRKKERSPLSTDR